MGEERVRGSLNSHGLKNGLSFQWRFSTTQTGVPPSRDIVEGASQLRDTTGMQ